MSENLTQPPFTLLRYSQNMSGNFTQNDSSELNFTSQELVELLKSRRLPDGMVVVLGFLSVLITIMNITICLLVCLNKQLRTFTNGIIVSLAVSDLIFGAVWLPYDLAHPYGKGNGYLTGIVFMSNISNLCILTLERAIAVTKPLKYRYFIGKYFFLMIVSAWLIPIVVSLLPLAWDEIGDRPRNEGIQNIYLIILLFLFIFVPYVLVISVYSTILFYVHRRQQRLCRISSGSEEGSRFRSELKVFRILFMITILFSAGWIPTIFLTSCAIADRHDLMIPEIFHLNTFGLGLSSLANGFLYAFFKPDFKRVINNIFKKCFNNEKMYGVTFELSKKRTGFTSISQSHPASTTRRETVLLDENTPVFEHLKDSTQVVVKVTVV